MNSDVAEFGWSFCCTWNTMMKAEMNKVRNDEKSVKGILTNEVA